MTQHDRLREAPVVRGMEYRFRLWDGREFVVTVDEEDPGDIGEPRSVDDGDVTYLSTDGLDAALAAPAPDLLAAHVHDAEVCFGCAEVHERALAEQDIITGHIPASREAAPDLLAAVEALLSEWETQSHIHTSLPTAARMFRAGLKRHLRAAPGREAE